MASAKLKAAVKRIKGTLDRNYETSVATPTAGPVGSGKLFIGGQVFDGDITGVTQVVNVGRPAAAQYAAKYGGGGGTTVVPGGSSTASVTLSSTPGTLSATTINDASGSHTHAIDASAAPGAAEYLLKSSSIGLLTLPLLAATTSVTTPSILSTGNLSIAPTGGNTTVTGTGTVTSTFTVGANTVNATAVAEMRSNAGYGSTLKVYRNNSNRWNVDFSSADLLSFVDATTSTSRFAMTLAGNAMIGTTTDNGYKLDVAGTMRATTSLTTPLLTTATNVDLIINPAGTGAVQFPNDQTLRTTSFDSSFPITGWQINEVSGVSGYSSLTIGKIQADELAVRVFVADEVRVDRGDEYWTKSYGIVATTFTTPSTIGGTVSVKFEDSPALAGAIFTNNDWVLIRKLDIDTGITLSNVWGQVATYVNNSDGTQNWTFTLRSGPTSESITKGSLAIDFGASGAALIHLSVIDSAGAPYIKMRKWAGANPYTPSNFTTYIQLGQLGSTGNSYYTPSGYGLYIRSTAAEDQFMVADDNGLQIRGPSISLYNSTTQTILMNNTSGINVREDVWGSWDNRRALQWWPDVASMSGDPSLSMYTGKVVGGLTANQNFSYIDANPTGNVLAGLSITAFGQGTATDATLYLEGGSQSLTTTPSITMTATNIDMIGAVDVTGSLSVGGTAVSLSGHTHSYLPLSGGTLTGTLITDIMRPATNNTKTVGTASYYYNAGYFDSLYVNTIVGPPSYSHTHSASEITSGTLDFARMATTWTGALTMDADAAGGNSNYIRWLTQTSTIKAWDLIGRAHDYATTAQQNDLLLTYTDNTTTYIVFQADNATRIIDFLNTPTVGGTAVSLSGHMHDDRYYTETEVNSLLSGYVPTSRTVTAGSGLTGGGALSGNVTISHDDTSTQSSVNNSGTTFIQDVTLDGYGHVTALGSVDVSTALDALYVNVTGDTMTGALTLEYSSAKLTVENTATTQYSSSSLILQNDAQDADTHWYIFAEKASAGAATGATTFQIRKRNSDGSVAATPFVVDASNNVILNNGYTAGGGTNGNVGIKKTPGAYALDVSGSMAASTSVLTPTVTTTSGNLSLTSVGGTVAVTGALTGSSTAAFTTSVSTPTVTTASGNLSLTSAGGTVAVTGALTGSSTGVFTSTLTAASDTDAINTFGRVRLGYAVATDTASFAHFDHNSSTSFALSQSAAGATVLNAASGQTISLGNAGSATVTVSASGIDLQSGKHIGSYNYASQSAGWRVDSLGGGDFRYLYADQLHVKAFIADLEQALAGGQIISKSVAVLASDFVAPYAGGTQLLTVEDLPSASNMAVFEANDIVGIRSFSRAGGSLTVAYCFGAVTGYTDGTGVQTWTFTRSGTTTYNAITQRGTATSNSTSSGTSTTVTKPTGVISGDVMLAVVTHDGAADTITATGWTIIGTYTSGTDINFAMYYRVAGGAEGSNYSFSTVSSHALAASIVAYYNVATPIFDDYSISTNSASTSMTGATVFGTATANMLVFLGGITNNSSVTPASGMTELIDAGSTGIRVYVAHQTLAASGETGSKVATIAASHASIVGMVALRPTYSAMTAAAGQVVPGTTIEADTLVLDFGIAGNGYYEVTAVDGAYGSSSPYAQVVTYATHPAIDGVARVRMGNLTGVSGATAGEYGLYAGSGTIGTTAQYMRISTAGVIMNNVPIELYSSGTKFIDLNTTRGLDIELDTADGDSNRAVSFRSSGATYDWMKAYNTGGWHYLKLASEPISGLNNSVVLRTSAASTKESSIFISTTNAAGSTTTNYVYLHHKTDGSGEMELSSNSITMLGDVIIDNGGLDMNSNHIVDVGTLSIAPPAGTSAITLTTPANQTTGMIYLTPANNGSSYGPHFTVGRNSNASTPAAGFMYIVNRGNTAYAIWPDASGNLRIGTTLPTSAQDTSGTVIGSQSSSLDTKDVVEPFTDYSSALNAIVDAPLYDFTYKSGAYNGEQFTGLITDYSPTFGMDKDEAHPAGKSLNTVTAHGYTFAAIKALHNRIEQLENQVKALQHVN